MSLTKRKLLDDLNAELDYHKNCTIKLHDGQDWDEGVYYLLARCETHDEDLSDEAAAFYHEQRGPR